jgi:threonine/homoserine efflux transporter RhtA
LQIRLLPLQLLYFEKDALKRVLGDRAMFWRHAPVALLVTIADISTLIAFEHVSASTFAVTKNMSLPITAVVYRVIMKRKLPHMQWVCLAHIVLALVAFSLRSMALR